MSIVDFTTGLFHDPANLRAFVDDPIRLYGTPVCPMSPPNKYMRFSRW
jgi:hypothetical protein